jgi:hypothetical protein
MGSRLFKLGLTSLAFVLACALALLSVLVQREGPELEAYGTLSSPASDEGCYKPVLKGGFPFAFLFDAPGISVQGKLSFGEDTLRPVVSALDIAVYLAVVLPAVRTASRCRSAFVRATNRGTA